MKDLGKAQYKPLGACIYCGAEGVRLSREHIIPLGLGGTATLPRASCSTCGRITGQVEGTVLRGSLWPVRVLRELRTRRPEQQPRTDDLTVVRHGKQQKMSVPIAEHPVLLPLPLFPLPGCLRPGYHVSGIELIGVHTLRFGPDPQEVGRRLGAEKLQVVRNDQPAAFARMVAKIAYAHFVAERGLDVGAGAPVIASILGREERIGHWVGCPVSPPATYPNLLHRLAILEDASTGFVGVIVHLFADSQSPEYLVVIRAPADAIPSA